MKHMNGNIRPSGTMPHRNSELLPSARIRCDQGRIRVGERTFQSASDALSVYMKQFDGKAAGRIQRSHSARNTSLEALIQKSAQGGLPSCLRSRAEPANVTGLLTGSTGFGDLSAAGLHSASSRHPRVVGGDVAALQSPKHSVSFNLPDSFDESHQRAKDSARFASRNMESLLNGSGQHPASVTLISTQNGSANSFSISRDTSSNQPSLSHLDSSLNGSLPHQTTNTSSGLYSQSLSKLNRSGIHDALIQNGREPNGDTKGDSPRNYGGPKQDTMRAKSEVEVLLTEAPSQGEIHSALKSITGDDKLKRLLKETAETTCATETSSNSSNKSVLQQEVEEALNRSAQLLENIKTDVLVSPRCVSDIGSLNTDILLSINPNSPASDIRAATNTSGRASRSRHRYSYHTPGHHARSLSVGPGSGVGEQNSSRNMGRRRSVDSLRSSASVLGDSITQDLNSSASALSDSEQVLRRLQAVGTAGEVGEMKARGVTRTGPPSWIQEIMPTSPAKGVNNSGWQDSVFSERSVSGGRQAPSWVNGLDQSDIASSVDTCDLHDAAETLMFAAVKKSEVDARKLSRNNSFSGVGSSSSRTKDRDRSKPPVSMNRIHQDLAGVDMTRPKTHTAATNLSSSVGADSTASVLRRKISEDTVHAKSSLDEYLRKLESEGELVNGGSVGEGKHRKVAGIPRCSSVDRLNGAGDHTSVPSDVTGASPITKDSNFSSKLCLDDPSLTPARHSRGLQGGEGEKQEAEASHQDLLDGERPWELGLPSFKAPVYVGNSAKSGLETPTLSGGQQPGSMEALKQMLFRLQNEESSIVSPTAGVSIIPQENGEATELVPALKDYDFEEEPGGHSLERALVHLGRLKTLVQTGTMPPQTTAAYQAQTPTIQTQEQTT